VHFILTREGGAALDEATWQTTTGALRVRRRLPRHCVAAALIIASIAVAAGADRWLRVITLQSIPTPPAPTAKLYDVTMRVFGVADNDVQVAQFMAKLNTSHLLQDVNLVISDEHTMGETKMRKFEIEMAINPNAEVQPGSVPTRNSSAGVELKS